MRTVDVATLTQNIKEMCIEANHFLSEDMKTAFTKAEQQEKAPLDKLEDKITGSKRGVIAIAIATANVNAVTALCFQAFNKKTIGIIISIKRINNLLILSIPF